jgi:hypothetical protein
VATATSGDPSPQALQAHIVELDRELRNIDFRLQFLYNQHISTLELLNSAKNLFEKLEKV